ncbi:hypothetical protein D3C80_1710210 [compost metagenome]
MQVDHIHVVSLQALETAVNTLFQHSQIPIRIFQTCGMTAFGKQIIVTAARTECLTDKLLAVSVTFSRINQIEPCIHCASQQTVYRLLVRAADF